MSFVGQSSALGSLIAAHSHGESRKIVWQRKLDCGGIVTTQQMEQVYANALVAVAPDMKDFAPEYVAQLFAHCKQLSGRATPTVVDLGIAGDSFYFSYGEALLGPLVVQFVRSVLTQAPHGSTVVFPARDAKIFYQCATVLSESADYSKKDLRISYPTVNRKTFGIEDEMNPNRSELLSITNPLVKEYLQQEGFLNTNGVVIADVGAWGTMVDAVLTASQRGDLPIKLAGVHFLFSHLPKNISGFMNTVLGQSGRDPSDVKLEPIADTFESLPRPETRSIGYERDTSGKLQPKYKARNYDDLCLSHWEDSLLAGVRAAAASYLRRPDLFPSAEAALQRVLEAHSKAQQGKFTGIFVTNTPTWSEGGAWRDNWKHGVIAPLKGRII